MENNNITIVIIDDDVRIKDDALIDELKEVFEHVIIFNDPLEGIEFVKREHSSELVVLLDLAFSANQPNGHAILEEIRTFSSLIPVIIWTAGNNVKPFSKLVDNKIYAFVEKTESSSITIDKIKSAIAFQKSNLQHALEEWIIAHPEKDKDKPYLLSVSGKQYTLSGILKEVRLETDIGRSFSKSLLKLTIDLLSRNKESFDE